MPKSVKTPIWDMLKGYQWENCVRFHMPGHKGTCPGSSMEELAGMFPYDVTEVPGTDNLHQPEGAIAEAQELLAKAYSADKSFLLINGSTCGMLAAINAAFSPGNKVIVDSACHRCVWNGLALAGAEGIVVEHLSPETIEAIVGQEPACKGVILTRPDYYGVCKDVQRIFQICEKTGLLLITDEAHGAHLAFGSQATSGEEGGYPVSAVTYSHFTVQSAHKMLGALNQTAYLHLHGKGMDYGQAVEKWLGILQTSSPSYLLLASADCARAYMEQYGKARLETLRNYTKRAAAQITEQTPFQVIQAQGLGPGETRTPDRLVIDTHVGGVSGYTAEVFLRTQKVQVELSDERRIVCLCTIFDSWKSFAMLIKALKGLQKAKIQEKLPTLEDVKKRQAGLKILKKQIGQRVERDIVPYPPGIPLVRRGETLTQATYEKIEQLYLAGGNLLGIRVDTQKGKGRM